MTADIIFSTYQDVLHRDVFPSVADVFYLASYPFLMAGLLLLNRSRSPGADRASLLDALIVTVGVGLVSWVFLVGPLAHSPDLTVAARVVSMAYPIMDVLLLATFVRLVVDGGPRPPAFWILSCGVGGLPVTDTLYSWIQLTGGYHAGSPIDLGWMTWYACWGAAALHPTMGALAEPAPPARSPPWGGSWSSCDLRPWTSGAVGGPQRLRQELPGADRDRLQLPQQPPGPAGQSPGDGTVPGRPGTLTNVVKHARLAARRRRRPARPGGRRRRPGWPARSPPRNGSGRRGAA